MSEVLHLLSGLPMITADYVRTMASYNGWQNENLYGAAGSLTDAQRKEQRGAFFGSIHGTLNHVLWGDQMWMSRFAGTPKPKSAGISGSSAMYEDWDELARERRAFDQVIMAWADNLDPAWLEGDLTWHSGATGREMTKPEMAARHPPVQSSDPPSRAGALHADPVRREAGRYGFALPERLIVFAFVDASVSWRLPGSRLALF